MIPVKDYYPEARLAIERMAELYYQLYGWDYTGLRFFSVYGPHEEAKWSYANMITQFLLGMKAGEPPVIYGDGPQTQDFTFQRCGGRSDSCVKKGAGIFNAGMCKAFSLNHVVELDKLEVGNGPEAGLSNCGGAPRSKLRGMQGAAA